MTNIQLQNVYKASAVAVTALIFIVIETLVAGAIKRSLDKMGGLSVNDFKAYMFSRGQRQIVFLVIIATIVTIVLLL